MNESSGVSFFAKRKSGLHIACERMNQHQPIIRPHNPHFNRERNNRYSIGSRNVPAHHRSRGRGCNESPSFRSTNFKGNFNRYAPQTTGKVLPKANQTLLRPNLNSSNFSSRAGHGNSQPETFVCEGIEVNFDSSDSEEEVRPWKIVKVLKKNVGKTENAALREDLLKVNDTRRHTVIPCAQVGEKDAPGVYQSDDEVQVLSPAPSNPRIVAVNPKRPSFVLLSSLRKGTTSNTFTPINNCAILKRPRFLFSQPALRPTLGPPLQSRFSLPARCFQEKMLPQLKPRSLDNSDDLTFQESRIIDDVLDMTEEVEMRARFLPYRYS